MPFFCRRPVLLLSFALCGCSLAFAESALRVRADVWMPFNGEASSDHPGYVVEILRAIWAGSNTTIDYQTMPWKDALTSAASGNIDAVIGANATEAKPLLVPREAAGAPRIGLFTLKNKQWNYESLTSLRSVKLGVIEGYSYFEALDGYIAARKGSIVILTGETPLEDGIRKLNSGEIDVLPEAMPVLVWTLKKVGLTLTDYRAVYVQEAEPIYVAFSPSPSGKAYAANFDEGLRRLRASGALADILKKYGLTDWK